MDPIESINPKKDTTLALMLEAQSRGWRIAYLTMADIFLSDGQAMGRIRYLKLFNDLEHWFEYDGEELGRLGDLDIILMRKDPPFDMEFILATYILERAQEEGALVVNDPRSLRDVNEKVFTAWFPDICPPSLLTRSKKEIDRFIREHHKVVMKPTGLMGGRGIFVVEEGDPNANVIVEEMTDRGSRYVQVQAYLPEIQTKGDKRIMLINGDPVSYGMARIPGVGDHRGNLAAGAKAEGFELSVRDRYICARLGPVLKERGLYFVGIDVIGDHLTEINVTSPTGIREIDKFFHTDIASMLFDELARLLTKDKD
jgi:glutathione synthase